MLTGRTKAGYGTVGDQLRQHHFQGRGLGIRKVNKENEDKSKNNETET